jgi:hypothetical protein
MCVAPHWSEDANKAELTVSFYSAGSKACHVCLLCVCCKMMSPFADVTFLFLFAIRKPICVKSLAFLVQSFHRKVCQHFFKISTGYSIIPADSHSNSSFYLRSFQSVSMEHREKRPRLGDAPGSISSPVIYTSSSEQPPSASSAMAESSTSTGHAALDAASDTVQDTTMQDTSEAVRTPDKSTWRGWAEIENDPVCLSMS